MFYFVNEFPKETNHCKIVVVNDSINSIEKLFELYRESLEFPYTTVTNFNAFRDVMEELEWLQESEIRIYHDGMPLLDENDMKDYLDYLNLIDVEWEKFPERVSIIKQHCMKTGKELPVDSWLYHPTKIIKVYFLSKYKEPVNAILHDYSWDFRECISYDEYGREVIDFVKPYPYS